VSSWSQHQRSAAASAHFTLAFGFGGLAGALLGVTGAFVGPLDFLFPLWLIVVSLTLWIKGRARAESTA